MERLLTLLRESFFTNIHRTNMALFNWSESIQSLLVASGNHASAEWVATQGAQVKVALIDSGIDLHIPAFEHLAKEPPLRFFTSSPTFSTAALVCNDPVEDTPDPMGHGTLYASMLAARDTGADAIIGMAPAASYCVIKARTAGGGTTKVSHLLDAIELAVHLDVDIAIIGQSIFRGFIRPGELDPDRVQRVFEKVEEKKLLVFCTLENREPGESWEGLASGYFPNCYLPVINCAKTPSDVAALRSGIQEQRIHFLGAGFRGKVYKIGGTPIDLKLPGDAMLPPAEQMDRVLSNSALVYLIGGLATLGYAFARKTDSAVKLDKAQMLDLLAGCCQFLDDATGEYDHPVLFQNYQSKPFSTTDIVI